VSSRLPQNLSSVYELPMFGLTHELVGKTTAGQWAGWIIGR